MKRKLAVILTLVVAVSVCCFASAGKGAANYSAVDHFACLKDEEIEKYYTQLSKWFTLMNKLKADGHTVTKPEQSDFKTLNKFIFENVENIMQYSADTSAEFWAVIFDALNKIEKGEDLGAFPDIISTIVDEHQEQKESIKAISDSFNEQYKVVFEDNHISKTEYQGFLAGICELNGMVQEVLKIDSGYDFDQSKSETKKVSENNISNILAEQKDWQTKFKSLTQTCMKDYYATTLDKFSLTLSSDGKSVQAMNIYFTWSAKNGEERTKKMLQMYSDDLAARLHKGYPDLPISSLTVFWAVPYHSDVGYAAKYQYYSEGDKMFLSKTLGLLYGKD